MGRGDQHVIIQVAIPKRLTDEPTRAIPGAFAHAG